MLPSVSHSDPDPLVVGKLINDLVKNFSLGCVHLLGAVHDLTVGPVRIVVSLLEAVTARRSAGFWIHLEVKVVAEVYRQGGLVILNPADTILVTSVVT